MQPTLTNPWNKSNITQFEEDTGQALFKDEQTLALFSKDFGKIIHTNPAAVASPNTIKQLVELISYANQHQLALTIRGLGLSQGGQSLPIEGGLSVSMQYFDKVVSLEDDAIWVEANCTWANLLEATLPQGKAPYVLPYNCNLSVGGVLSAGGVGAASFKYGAINAYVDALEVVDGTGLLQVVDKASPLFHACLSGQGRFGVITKVKMRLKKVKSSVQTFFLVYADLQQWFEDVEKVRDKVDYMELICSPAPMGGAFKEGKREPMAQWLFGMHLSVGYDSQKPQLQDLASTLKPWRLLHTQEEPVHSYFLRHNGRFEMMRRLGQWDLVHPWYECYVPEALLKQHLDSFLKAFPLHYANIVHVVPIARQKANFMMFPEGDSICSLMILNPGVPEDLKASCLKVIADLDAFLLEKGCKRYLSGYLGEVCSQTYWSKHFGAQYDLWMSLKQEFDPKGVFRSRLYPQ